MMLKSDAVTHDAQDRSSRAGSATGPWAGRLADGVRGLSGWRRRLLATALGAAAAAALPPVHAVPLLLAAFSGLVWLLDGAPSRRAAFGTGWWFGVGFFAAGLYWIGHAFLVDAARFGWMIPFALFGLSAGLALFPGLATLAAHGISRPGIGRVVTLAGTWTLAEMLRGTIMTGFPWNLVAYAWTTTDAMMQAGAVVGAYGVSLITVLCAAAPAAVLAQATPLATAASARGRYWFAAAAAAVLGLTWASGAARLAVAGPVASQPMVDGVSLRLVQANINQSLKWRPELREAHFKRQIVLSRGTGFDAVTAVVWPETASSYSLDWASDLRRLAATAAPPGGVLLTGALRTTPPGVEPVAVWNSLMAVDDAGRLAGLYDKAHLVPFGEFIPLRKIVSLPKITPGAIDFSPGPGRVTLTANGLPPFSPLICYEAIFPGQVVDGNERPAWMLNVTNDAWFGHSAGPHQHFASVRWRAVEEGLPVARAAVTGVSAVVDPYGRVVASLGLGETGVVDAPLPVALSAPLFARWGNGLAIVLAAGLALITPAARGMKFAFVR